MKSAFNIETGKWEIAWPGRVARHDVVFLSPPDDPMRGMPIGNGDIGVLCWTEGSRIILVVNKCDLWDDASYGKNENWHHEQEDYSTTLRHGCRILIDFRMPIFDLFYLSDFQGRISLADGKIAFNVSGPFGSASFSAFVNHDDGILCCDVECNLEENLPVDVTVERFGSRTFSHWYSLIRRDAYIGLAGTMASVDDNTAYVTHQLTSGKFAVGCRVISADSEVTYRKDHSHAATASVSGSSVKKFSFVASITEPIETDPIVAVKDKLDAAESTGIQSMYEKHAEAWKEFWLRSLVECGNDYIDNLWHTTMYYLYSSQRGKYPGRFISGMWAWNRDVQQWNFYFHWNQQSLYWPVNAAGHHDLCESYLDFRFRSLEIGKQDAREYFQTDGAFVSDVVERRGYNSISESGNHTPVAQIALDFWRQYQFTQDKQFLNDRALPYMLEAAKFFESLFEREEDGKYHAKRGTGYEGWIWMKDTTTELSTAEALYRGVIEALSDAGVTEPRAEKWKEILENLAPVLTIELDDQYVDKSADGALIFKMGEYKGHKAASDRLLASGYGFEEKKVLCSMIPSQEKWEPLTDYNTAITKMEVNDPFFPPYGVAPRDLKGYDGIFPAEVEFCAVYPSGAIGLNQKGTELFDAAVNAAILFTPDLVGYDPLPVVMARLGLSDVLWDELTGWPDRAQFYPNGWGHYGRDIMKAETGMRYRTVPVRDADKPNEGYQFHFPTFPFRHMGLDSVPVFACAVNESLMQSHDGIIRVAPALQPDQNARFTLHAVGGFIVSSEISNGKPLWIAIDSKAGKDLIVENPWQEIYVYVNNDPLGVGNGELLELSTQPGDQIILTPNPETIESWQTDPITHQQNEKVKKTATGLASLGLERMF